MALLRTIKPFYTHLVLGYSKFGVAGTSTFLNPMTGVTAQSCARRLFKTSSQRRSRGNSPVKLYYQKDGEPLRTYRIAAPARTQNAHRLSIWKSDLYLARLTSAWPFKRFKRSYYERKDTKCPSPGPLRCPETAPDPACPPKSPLEPPKPSEPCPQPQQKKATSPTALLKPKKQFCDKPKSRPLKTECPESAPKPPSPLSPKTKGDNNPYGCPPNPKSVHIVGCPGLSAKKSQSCPNTFVYDVPEPGSPLLHERTSYMETSADDKNNSNYLYEKPVPQCLHYTLHSDQYIETYVNPASSSSVRLVPPYVNITKGPELGAEYILSAVGPVMETKLEIVRERDEVSKNLEVDTKSLISSDKEISDLLILKDCEDIPPRNIDSISRRSVKKPVLSLSRLYKSPLSAKKPQLHTEPYSHFCKDIKTYSLKKELNSPNAEPYPNPSSVGTLESPYVICPELGSAPDGTSKVSPNPLGLHGSPPTSPTKETEGKDSPSS